MCFSSLNVKKKPCTLRVSDGQQSHALHTLNPSFSRALHTQFHSQSTSAFPALTSAFPAVPTTEPVAILASPRFCYALYNIHIIQKYILDDLQATILPLSLFAIFISLLHCTVLPPVTVEHSVVSLYSTSISKHLVVPALC